MNVLDIEVFEAEMTLDAARVGQKNCSDTVNVIEPVE